MATIKSKAALQAVKTSTHKINNADWQDFVESAVLKLSSTGYANPAMLGSGTASSVTYLRGDGVWAEVEAGTTLDVSAFIETLLDDPDAATARATLGLGTISTLDSSLFVVKTSTVADGASAVAHYLDTSAGYVTAGAKLLSLRNATVEKFSVGYDGQTQAYTFAASLYLWSNGGVYGQVFNAPNRTVVASAPMFEGAQTWNNALTTFKAFTIDVTDTASASGSLLMDLRTGGYSMATITKGGYLTLKGDAGANYISMGADTGNSGVAYIVAGSEIRFYVSNYSDGFVAYTPSAGVIGFKGAYNYNSGVAASFLLAGGANDTTPGNLYLRGGYSTTPSVCGVVKIQSADGLTDYVTVTNTGKVGIGTTSPVATLHVNAINPVLRISNTAAGSFYTHYIRPGVAEWSVGQDGADEDKFKIASSVAFAYTRFTITSAGNVGIGTTAPGAALEIRSATTLTSGGVGNLCLSDSTTPAKRLIMGIDTSVGALGIGYILAEQTGLANLPLYLGGGTVGVGTTTPDFNLHVAGISATIGVGGEGNGYALLTAGDGSTAGYLALHTPGGTRLGYIGYNPGLFQFACDVGQFYFGGGTRTASNPLLFSQTWNNALVAFSAFTVDITDTASASASLLMDLQVGGTSKFSVSKNGSVNVLNGSYSAPSITFGGASTFGFYGLSHGVGLTTSGVSDGLQFDGTDGGVMVRAASEIIMTFGNTSHIGGPAHYGITMWQAGDIRWTSGFALATYDVALKRVSAGGLGVYQGDGTTGGRIYAYDLLLGETACGISAGNVANVSLGGYRALVASYTGNATEAFMASAFLFTSNGNYPATTCLTTDAAGILALKNGTNAQAFRVYGTTTGPKYAEVSHDGSFAYLTSTQGIWLAASGMSLLIQSHSFAPYQTGAEDLGLVGQRFKSLNVGDATLTASAPVINATQTWNNGAAQFYGIVADFTDTASAFASYVLDLRVGGSSIFNVSKGGALLTVNGASFKENDSGGVSLAYHRAGVTTGANGQYAFTSTNPTGTVDLTLVRDAAGVLAQRNGTNAQAFRIYNTINGSDYDAGVVGWYANTYFVIGTPEFMGIRGGSGSARAVWVASNAAIYFSTNSDGGGNWQIGNDHVFAPMDAFDIGRAANRVAAYYGGGNTVTASAPVINLTQTWNSGATTFTAFKVNVTDTASASGSLLMDLQVGGVSKFSVDKDGTGHLTGGLTADSYVRIGGLSAAYWTGSSTLQLLNFPGAGLLFIRNGSSYGAASGGRFGWSSSADYDTTLDTGLSRNAAGVVEVNNGTAGTYRDLIARNIQVTNVHNGAAGAVDLGAISNFILRVAGNGFYPLTDNSVDLGYAGGSFSWKSLNVNAYVKVYGTTITTSAPVLNVAQTWNAGGVTFTGILANFTDTASATGSMLIDLQIGGASKFKVEKDGRVYTPYISYASALVASDVGAGGTTTGAILQYATSGVYGAVKAGLSLGSGGFVAWDSATSPTSGSPDVAFYRNAAGVVEINNGTAGTYRDLTLRNIIGQTGYHELIEMTAPAAPAANTVRLYAEDNGAGKTRLMALFPSGAAQQVAIEP